MGLAKWVETRSWPTRRRGWVAIHASQGLPKGWRDLDRQHPYSGLVVALGRNSLGNLPRGAIVAIGKLEDCRPTGEVRDALQPSERAWGDYGDGRFALLFGPICRLREPVPCRGTLGFWPVWADLAADLLAALEAGCA